MKSQPTFIIAALAWLALSVLNCPLSIAHAQSTVFTYQGRVLDHGTNFNGMGQFQFALVTSTNVNHIATATANPPSGGFITGYAVTGGGNGYVTPPAVTVAGGGGSGAAATANLTGGVVTSISVASTGNGAYTNAPAVTIVPPPANPVYTTYWSNDGTSVNGSEPSAAVPASVANGLFTVVLGDTTVANMAAISALLFAQPNLQLRIWFNDGANGFAVLDPAQALTPTPYAISAENAAGAITVQNNTNGAPNLIAGASVNYVASGVIGGTISGGGSVYDPNFYGSPGTNSVTANFGTVNGGDFNTASGVYATVSGALNTASGDSSAVGGGYDNTASGIHSVVGGGENNTANGNDSTVGGGNGNNVSSDYSTVAGGSGNFASGEYSAVSGGGGNTASGAFAMVAGGESNLAQGDNSFAAGFNARAVHSGSFVWNDFHAASFSSTAANQFAVHAMGGVRLVGNVTTGDLSLSENGAYHNLSLSGGNSSGYLYGSYNSVLGDGIHLGYNFYYDAAGAPQVPHPGASTSRISMSYGTVSLATGPNDTAPADRLLVDINGRVGIGRSPTANLLEVAGNASKTTAGSWLANSDARIKTGIATITNALDTLERVRLVSFYYTDDYRATHPGIEDRSYLNVIAQEFARVFPDAVKGSGEKLPDGSEILQVDTYPLTIYSAAAIQELNQKLEAENAELRGRLDRLEKLIQAEPKQ